MAKYYRQAFWTRETNVDRIILVKAGQREEFEMLDAEQVEVSIPVPYIASLVNFLTEQGYVRPIINNESRKDDVNIINKLIDVLDKHATS